MKLRHAMVCSSNQNRSMEAHSLLKRQGFNVSSCGTGAHVKLPGPSLREPNVYDFGTPYKQMYDDLRRKDPDLYKRNGILPMLKRNSSVKTVPQRWQDNAADGCFDVVLTFEEKVFDMVIEDRNNREHTLMKTVLIFNLDVKDNHEEAAACAWLALDLCQEGQQSEGPPPYKHIERNEFSYRKHKKQKEEDIAICVCQYDANDPDSACGERCLNLLTSTECTPGYCPCGNYCRNQRFQKCEYAMSRLFKTEGRGWGLLADENIKAGQFVIEYCGEVISWKEAKRRSQAYEAEGLKDAFIISLNAYESIDATRKGSLARFINHSCQPNCVTRKWNVLGEIRVGIFAKQDIPVGTELAYDYNFEWYGGAKVRCLCGAACCSGFLGAKSRGFQEATYLWEDDDDRYSVENVPLYDSEDDEPTSKFLKAIVASKDNAMAEQEHEDFMRGADGLDPVVFSESKPIAVEPLNSVPMEMDEGKNEIRDDNNFYPQDAQQTFTQKSSMISRIRSNSACRNYHIQSSPLSKSSPHYPNGKSKIHARKQVNVKLIGERLSSKEACEELLSYEESKNQAASQLDSLYDEIRPAIEEHERDSQDSVSTSVAEKWIKASCCKLKAEFDLYAAIIKNISCTPRRARDDVIPKGEGIENGIKYLENGP